MSDLENAAWRGETHENRRASARSPWQTGGFKEVELNGNIPDFVSFWRGCGFAVLGVMGIIAFFSLVLPEWKNLEGASTCAGDCVISKLSVLAVCVVTALGGVASGLTGIISAVIASGAFNENTIRARIRDVEVR